MVRRGTRPACQAGFEQDALEEIRRNFSEVRRRLYRRRDLELVQRIKSLLYDERLTLEGARKRLIAESRGKTTAQLELGIREATYAETLRRIQERLRTLRSRLAP